MSNEDTPNVSNENIILKRISIFASLIMILTYCIGFIYDAAYLEVFGVDYFEIVGSPLAYLSIGGIYLLSVIFKNYTWVIIISFFIGCGIGPAYRMLKPYLDKWIVKKDFTKVILGLSPLLLIFLIPVVYDAQKDANEIIKEKESDKVCLDSMDECVEGHILRYRDSKIIFYWSQASKVHVFTDRKLKESMHGNNISSGA